MKDLRDHYHTIKCATCPITTGCGNCIRGDDLCEIYELRRRNAELVEAAVILIDEIMDHGTHQTWKRLSRAVRTPGGDVPR